MGDLISVRVPDIGDFEDVEVVEVLVGPGDRVDAEDSLISVESDKATMEIPSPVAGVIRAVHVALGDRVSEGSPVVELDVLGDPSASTDIPGGDSSPASEAVPTTDASASEIPLPAPQPSAPSAPKAPENGPAPTGELRPGEAVQREPPIAAESPSSAESPHASPQIRRLARELGVDLARASGTGPHGRVLEEDVKSHVRAVLGGASDGPADDAAPIIDPSRFGPVHEQPLSKIQRVAARNLSRSWRTIPHVTQQDEADVTELEAYRRSLADQARERGLKLSPLHFVMKAVSVALRDFPNMRSSLGADTEKLVVKDYVHLGIAVDTDHGLVVPVVRDVDRKGIFALVEELAALAERARARRLVPADMQGSCFTISSLGGIGGTAFSPIVNAPEVAILGLSKLSVRPVWSERLDVGAQGRFEPRIMMPLSLSYDHRVIDGAMAVRFTTRLVWLLSDPAHLLL